MTVAPPPPLAPGVPLLGNALPMMGDVQRFLVDTYQELGPVFRVRALNQGFVIMAGADANRFLLEHGEEAFTSEESFGGLDQQFGMRVHVLRGRPHRHLRKLLATGLSRDLLAARWDPIAAETGRILDDWANRPTVAVVDACQRLAAAQLSIAYTGASSAARFETLRSAFELVLDVTVAGKWPAAALRWPAYRRSRTEIHRFARAALAERAAGPADGIPDLLDQALDATDEHGVPYPLDVRAGMALQGYFAGINTVAYLYSFMIDVLLRNPAVLARVTGEVDAAHRGSRLTFDRLREMPALHGLVMETLRVHPPAPASARTAAQPFDFGGCRIDRGQRVLVATCVTHHLPEHFPDPQQFDLDRDFTAGRKAAVYAPFSVGGHTCLGAGMTQVLSVATIAMLVRRLDLSPTRPGRPLRITATPGPNPGRRFRVCASRRQH